MIIERLMIRWRFICLLFKLKIHLFTHAHHLFKIILHEIAAACAQVYIKNKIKKHINMECTFQIEFSQLKDIFLHSGSNFDHINRYDIFRASRDCLIILHLNFIIYKNIDLKGRFKVYFE